MSTTSVRDARKHLSSLLDQVERGEEVVISRRGKAVARLGPAENNKPVRFTSRAELRDSLPPMHESAATTVRKLREDERY